MNLVLQLNQIEQQLRQARRPSEASENGFARLGYRVPEVRAILKKDLLWLRQWTANQRLEFWHYAYRNTSIYEVGSLAIYAYQYHRLTRQEFNKLRQWVNRCDCWEHSDDLSKVYSTVVEQNPDWVLPWLRKWNDDRNPWKRRQSVVSLLEYAQKRKRVESFEVLLSFVTPLLSDDAYYVQKGVGWTLREIFNVYPEKTLAFYQKNFATIDPTAWSAAIEKLEPSDRTRLNLLRKQKRMTTS